LYIIFLCLWLIALFIFLNSFRTTADLWISLTFFLWGCSGLAVFLSDFRADFVMLRFAENILASIFLVWSAFSFLIYALHMTGRMPVDILARRKVEIGLALPAALMHIAIMVYPIITPGDFTGIYMRGIIYVTLLAAPYYLLSVLLLTANLIYKRTNAWRTETSTSYILVVPIALVFLFDGYILPSFGFDGTWWLYLVAVMSESVIFLFFLIQKNALGLSYRKINSTREETERSIIEGTGALQHALKNSLSIVLLNLQNAKYGCEKNNAETQIVPKIAQALEACDHAKAILERIMLKINPINLELRECELLPIVEHVVKHCQFEHAAKKIHVEQIIKVQPHLLIDPVHIREALVNIVNNAMEAVEDDGHGQVKISLTTYKKFVNLQIEDNGHGLDKEILKKVGTPVLTSKRDGKHYGLGLFYVTRVITLHSGRFSLRKAPQGSTMAEILLPLS